MRRPLLHQLVEEVRRQPEVLEEFAKSKLTMASKGSIFVGAGDSYAAALCGFYVSGGRCLALDPYSLTTAPAIAAGREVFFVSASGRTSSNIVAARRVKEVARVTTAITANHRSKLAAAANRVARLPMTVVPRSPGLLSFSLSLLAVLKASIGNVSCDFRRAFQMAESDCREVSFGRGTTYFLGNSAAYAVCMYAAAKVYELFGTKAHAELLEEFSHMELFSLRRADAVDVFACFDPAGIGTRLQRALVGQGYQSYHVPSRGESDTERLFHSVFVAQLAVLRKARRSVLRPRFLDAKDRLKISDSMIY
jgi:D-arabinose 5-phosphate isomerase GutQ